MSSSAELRTELLGLIGTNPGGHLDAALRSTFADKLKAYAAKTGAKLLFGMSLSSLASARQPDSPNRAIAPSIASMPPAAMMASRASGLNPAR